VIIDTTLYDLSMTLIISKVTDDSIVTVADGMALNEDNGVVTTKAKKLFPIKNGIFWGAAAEGIYPGELDHLADYMQDKMPCEPPYNMQTIAKMFQLTLQTYFRRKGADFWIDAILVGYSRTADNKPIQPVVYAFSSKEGYDGIPSSGFTIGKIDEKYRVRVNKIPNKTEEAVACIQKIISEVEKEEASVGGDVRTVIIKGNDIQETIQTTN